VQGGQEIWRNPGMLTFVRRGLPRAQGAVQDGRLHSRGTSSAADVRRIGRPCSALAARVLRILVDEPPTGTCLVATLVRTERRRPLLVCGHSMTIGEWTADDPTPIRFHAPAWAS
jgi:hypothetical protein